MEPRDLSVENLVEQFNKGPENEALIEEMQLRIVDPSQSQELFEEIKALTYYSLDHGPVEQQRIAQHPSTNGIIVLANKYGSPRRNANPRVSWNLKILCEMDTPRIYRSEL